MSTQSNSVKGLQMSVLMTSVFALVTFAYSGGGAAAADSMSGKWLSPAPSAAKKKLSDPQLNTESDGSLFWKITTGKSQCRRLTDEFPKQIGGTWSITSEPIPKH